ncbi:MAG: TOBE domain-containing protein [Pseudomonadota bacterium]
MQDELKAIQRQVGTTFVHVTHDQEEAMAIADRIVVMNAGRIEDHGPPTRIYRQPATLFAADFMGEMNHIPARLTGSGAETPFGPLAHAQGGSGPAVACLRPEAIHLGAGTFNLGQVRVRDAAFFGTHVRAHLVPEAAADLLIVAHLPADSLPAPGEMLTLCTEPDAFCVFAEEA